MDGTNPTMSTTSLARMSHRSDPDTSHEAAQRVRRGDKLPLLYGAITGILTVDGPLTAKEIHTAYVETRGEIVWLPVADLQDIRRRLTELQHDQQRVVDTGERRNGERILALAEAVAA